MIPFPLLLPILLLLKISDFLLMCVCLVFSTHFVFKRLPEIWFYPEAIPQIESSGVGFLSTYTIFENVHEKLFDIQYFERFCLWTFFRLFASSCHRREGGLHEIYTADRGISVLCALHLYFQLKSQSDYFLKEFRFSWGRLKIMSTWWFIKWVSKWKWTDWYWFFP